MQQDVSDRWMTHVSSGNMKGVVSLWEEYEGELAATAGWGLSLAASQGFSDVVAFLMGKTDPSADFFRPLRFALKNRRLECVKLLVPVSDMSAVEKSLSENGLFDSLEMLRSVAHGMSLRSKHGLCHDVNVQYSKEVL